MASVASSSGRTLSMPSIPTVSTPLLTGAEWVILDLFIDSASKPHPAEHLDDFLDFGVFSEKIGEAKLLG